MLGSMVDNPPNNSDSKTLDLLDRKYEGLRSPVEVIAPGDEIAWPPRSPPAPPEVVETVDGEK